MRKLSVLLALTFCFVLSVGAQVTIGSDAAPDVNALLDLKNKQDNTSDKGLLLPRVALTATTDPSPMANHVAGMVVYNTVTRNDVEPAFYYNDGTRWFRIHSESSAQADAISQLVFAQYVTSTGQWIQDVPIVGNDNTITFKVTNIGRVNLQSLDFEHAVTLAGASQGLSVAPSSNYQNVSLSVGQSVSLTYVVTGTPQVSGVLEAHFSAIGNTLTAVGTVPVQVRSSVRAVSLAFQGDYISNATFNGTQRLTLQLTNFTTTPLNNVDLSQALTLVGVDGVSIVPNQNTSVSIPANAQPVTLTYLLQGTPKNPGLLEASFSPTAQITGLVNAKRAVDQLTGVSITSMAIFGDYVVFQSLDGTNKVRVTLSNTNSYALTNLNFSTALAISGIGASGITIPAGQHTSVSIPQNGTVQLEYTLQGKPVNPGQITFDWQNGQFGARTETELVIMSNLSVTPNYLEQPVGGRNYTFQVTSDQQWAYEIIETNGGWLTVTGVTGQTGNGSFTISTQPHTSEKTNEIVIRVYRISDNVGVRVKVVQPPTDALTTNIPSNIPTTYYDALTQISIHSGNTKTYTVNYSGAWSVLSMPDWVQSAVPSGNQLIITPKERTEPGPPAEGDIVITYGAGYQYRAKIVQRQKARKAPQTAPFRADKGYRVITTSTQLPHNDTWTLYEERPGNDAFTDLMPLLVNTGTNSPVSTQGFYYKVEYNAVTNKSGLYISPNLPEYRFFKMGATYAYKSPSWSGLSIAIPDIAYFTFDSTVWFVYRDESGVFRELSNPGGYPRPLPIVYIMHPDLAGTADGRSLLLEKATTVFAFDGYDEDTPAN